MNIYSRFSIQDLIAYGAPISSLIKDGTFSLTKGSLVHEFRVPDNAFTCGTSLKTLIANKVIAEKLSLVWDGSVAGGTMVVKVNGSTKSSPQSIYSNDAVQFIVTANDGYAFAHIEEGETGAIWYDNNHIQYFDNDADVTPVFTERPASIKVNEGGDVYYGARIPSADTVHEGEQYYAWYLYPYDSVGYTKSLSPQIGDDFHSFDTFSVDMYVEDDHLGNTISWQGDDPDLAFVGLKQSTSEHAGYDKWLYSDGASEPDTPCYTLADHCSAGDKVYSFSGATATELGVVLAHSNFATRPASLTCYMGIGDDRAEYNFTRAFNSDFTFNDVYYYAFYNSDFDDYVYTDRIDGIEAAESPSYSDHGTPIYSWNGVSALSKWFGTSTMTAYMGEDFGDLVFTNGDGATTVGGVRYWLWANEDEGLNIYTVENPNYIYQPVIAAPATPTAAEHGTTLYQIDGGQAIDIWNRDGCYVKSINTWTGYINEVQN